MTFGQPQLLYGLVLLPLATALTVWTIRRRRATIATMGDPTLIERLSASVNWRGRRWQTGLWFLALALVLIALARPQWGSEVQVVERQGVQIMVALDVSNSMLSQDIKPNRLERAKLEIADMMNHLNGDGVGLVVFSGASFIQMPITADYATARTFLENASPGVISRQGTAIAEAIGTSLAGFDAKRASQKVIVLVTDGENHEGNIQAATNKAREDDVIIYTFGLGSPEGAPIPEYDRLGWQIGFKEDRNGEVVLSRLDEETLQEIAQATGGRYYPIGANSSGIQSFLGELGSLQQDNLESEFETRRIERFQLFLFAALLALVIAELIPDRVFRLNSMFSMPFLRMR